MFLKSLLNGKSNGIVHFVITLLTTSNFEFYSWKDLEEKAFKNFGMINSTSQETILQDLYEKVAEVYKMIVGDIYLF